MFNPQQQQQRATVFVQPTLQPPPPPPSTQQQQRRVLGEMVDLTTSTNADIFEETALMNWPQAPPPQGVPQASKENLSSNALPHPMGSGAGEYEGLEISWKSPAREYIVNRYFYFYYPGQIEFEFLDPVVAQKCLGGTSKEPNLVKLFIRAASVSERDKARLTNLENKIAAAFPTELDPVLPTVGRLYESITEAAIDGFFVQGHIGLIPFWKDEGRNLVAHESEIPRVSVINLAIALKGLKTNKNGPTEVGARMMNFVVELKEILLKFDLTSAPASDYDDAAAAFRPHLGACRFNNTDHNNNNNNSNGNGGAAAGVRR